MEFSSRSLPGPSYQATRRDANPFHLISAVSRHQGTVAGRPLSLLRDPAAFSRRRGGCSMPGLFGRGRVAGPASVCDTHVGDGAMRGQPLLLVQVFEHGHEVSHTWRILVGPPRAEHMSMCWPSQVATESALRLERR